MGEALGLALNNASARFNQYERSKHTSDYTTLKRIAEILEYLSPYFYCESDQDANELSALQCLESIRDLTGLENGTKLLPPFGDRHSTR